VTAALRHNANVIESLGSALRSGEHGLRTFPDLLKRVIEEGSWREFVTQRGEHVTHNRFEQFVSTPPLKGLGADMGLVRNIVRDRADVVNLLDKATQRPVGHPQADSIGNNVPNRPEGNTAAKALRRLRKDAPELHAEVLAGNLSAHRAMVNAGFRRRTATVPVDDPIAAARTIRRQFNKDALVQLVAALLDPEGT
jgi:hypothetical protein